MTLSSQAFADCDVNGNCDGVDHQEAPPQPEPDPTGPRKAIGGALNLEQDRVGQVTGSIGERDTKPSPDRSGWLSGTIGGESGACQENDVGQVNCR